MQISCASEAAPGQVNEDYAICGPNWATVLDGATAPRGVDSGCIHNIPWLVHQLAATLSTKMLLDEAFPLTDMLAAAIEDTCSAHANTCDLQNPDSPSTTVSIIRISSDTLEYLTLGDSPIALWRPDNQITVLKDDRTDHLPGGRPYTVELVRSRRNKPGGFWVASTEPKAAYHAVTGNVPLTPGIEVGLFTDGATRLIDVYGYDWAGFFASLRDLGPARVINRVRDAERNKPHPYGKRYDDATVVHVSDIAAPSLLVSRPVRSVISMVTAARARRRRATGRP